MSDIDVRPLLFFGLLLGVYLIGFLSGYLANDKK